MAANEKPPGDKSGGLNSTTVSVVFLLATPRKPWDNNFTEAIPLRQDKEQPMSLKLSFQVRIGKWRLTISISR